MNTNGITRVENGLSLQADLQRKEVIETIKQTVARGATDAQPQMFLVLASRYNLDPFLREIWCAQIGGQMTVLTSRDGYLKIAQRIPISTASYQRPCARTISSKSIQSPRR